MPQSDEILVVTATLGRSRWLGETVGSVDAVRAAGVPVRHRIVAPAGVAGELQDRFPNCEVVEAEAAGVYPAINRGLEAGGDWVARTWLNDDDRWRSDGIRVALGSLRDDVDVVYGRVDYIDSSGRRLGALPVESSPERFRLLMAGGISPMSQHGTFVRRALWEAMGGFDEGLKLGADFDFWARAVASGARFRFVDSVVGEYRLRPGQLSSDMTTIGKEIALSADRTFPGVPRWKKRLASLAFRLRHAGELFERRRITGHWRSQAVIADAGAKGESP